MQIQVETRKQSIIWEFEKYRRLLKKKQPPGRLLEVEAAAALASLQQEERETMQKLELNHEALIQQSRVLWRMIAELEERSQRPVRWMLQVRSRFSWEVWARPEGSLAFWERGLPSLQYRVCQHLASQHRSCYPPSIPVVPIPWSGEWPRSLLDGHCLGSSCIIPVPPLWSESWDGARGRPIWQEG